MKATIHYNGTYEDEFIIEANTLEEIREIAYVEINKRNWKEEDCWSEVKE